MGTGVFIYYLTYANRLHIEICNLFRKLAGKAAYQRNQFPYVEINSSGNPFPVARGSNRDCRVGSSSGFRIMASPGLPRTFPPSGGVQYQL